jgi:ATP-dependent DNA ligase
LTTRTRCYPPAKGTGLEGIVSKRRGDPYRTGSKSGWIKGKTAAWRAANQERYKLFEDN